VLALTTPTAITLIVAAFFVLLALIALGRAMFTREPPRAKRFRVGVFVERDREGAEKPASDEQPEKPSPPEPPKPA
jgi:hypothetical protein